MEQKVSRAGTFTRMRRGACSASIYEPLPRKTHFSPNDVNANFLSTANLHSEFNFDIINIWVFFDWVSSVDNAPRNDVCSERGGNINSWVPERDAAVWREAILGARRIVREPIKNRSSRRFDKMRSTFQNALPTYAYPLYLKCTNFDTFIELVVSAISDGVNVAPHSLSVGTWQHSRVGLFYSRG